MMCDIKYISIPALTHPPPPLISYFSILLNFVLVDESSSTKFGKNCSCGNLATSRGFLFGNELGCTTGLHIVRVRVTFHINAVHNVCELQTMCALD